MENGFTIPFEFNGKKYEPEAVFIRMGFIHQFHIQLNEYRLIIEFDEERNYRVINVEAAKDTNINPEMLKALIDKVCSLH